MTNADIGIVVALDTTRLDRGIGDAKRSLGGLGDFAAGAFKTAALGVAGLGVGIAAIGIPIAKVGVDFNAMKETALTSFSVLLGSGDKANAMMEDLLKFAAETPFEFEEIAKSAKSLLTANIGPEAMQSTLKTVGDIASGLNIPFSELSDIYAKIMNQGRLYGEDINQLQGRGIPIVQELSKMYGVTAGEIKKMVEEGKIGAPDIEKAFQRMTGEGGMFKDMMLAQSKTFSGMLSTLQDGLGQLAGELAEPIFDVLKEGLGGVLALMDTPEFKEGIKEFAKVISTVLKSGIEWLKDNLPKMQKGLEGAASGFAVIQQVIGAVWNFVQPILQTVFAELAKFWTEIQPKLTAAWENIQKVTMQVFGAIVQFIQDHSEEIRMIFEGAWKIIQGIFQTAWALISGIVKVALDLLAGDFDAAGRDFTQMMRDIWGGIQLIIQGAWQEIQGYVALALNTLGQAIWDKLTEIAGWFNQQFANIINSLQSLPGQFAQVGASIIQGIIDGLWAAAGNVNSALWDIIQQAIKNALNLGGAASFTGENFGGARPMLPAGNTSNFGGVTINFNGENAPRTAAEANRSAGLFVDALRAKGYVV